MIDSLARLIVHAGKSTQLWITTHSAALAGRIEEYSGQPRIRLQLVNGETRVEESSGEA
jgi:predicted ATPase